MTKPKTSGDVSPKTERDTAGNQTQGDRDITEKVNAGIDKWVAENLRNTAFSRNTDAWNLFQKALPKLAGAIVEEIE